jgi:hypothetical protein
LPPAKGVGSGIESVVLLIAVGAVLARKRRRWKRASRWQSSILRLAIGVQGGVPKDRIAIRPKPSRTMRLEVGRPGRLGWVCSKAGLAAVDPRGFSCVVGGWSASAEGEMTSSPRGTVGCFIGRKAGCWDGTQTQEVQFAQSWWEGSTVKYQVFI